MAQNILHLVFLVLNSLALQVPLGPEHSGAILYADAALAPPGVEVSNVCNPGKDTRVV